MSSRADFLHSMGLSEDDMADPTVVTKTSKYQTSVSAGTASAPTTRSMKGAYDDDDDSRPLGGGIQPRATANRASYTAPAPVHTELRYDSYVTSEGRDGRGEVDDEFMTRLREKQQRRDSAAAAAAEQQQHHQSPDLPSRKPPQVPVAQVDDTEPMYKKSAASERAALINSCLSNDRVFMDGVPPPPARDAPAPASGSAYGGDRNAFLKSMGIDNAGGGRPAPVSRPAHNLGADDDDEMPRGRPAPPPVRDADDVVLQTAQSHQELIRQRRAKAKAEAALKRGGGGGEDTTTSVEVPTRAEAPPSSYRVADEPPKPTTRNVYGSTSNVAAAPVYDRASQEYAKAARPAAVEPADTYRKVREMQPDNFSTPSRNVGGGASLGDSPQHFQPPPVASDITLGARKGNVYSQGNNAASYGSTRESSAPTAPPASQFTTARSSGAYNSTAASAGLNASPVNNSNINSSSYRRDDSTNNFNSTTGSLGGTIRSEEDGLSAAELKDMGNRYFESGDFRKAVRMYSKSIEKDPSNAALYSNRSAAYLQASKQMGIDTRTMALRDADKVVELRPTWFKGYSRQGDAYFKLEHFKEAIQSYERGLTYDEDNVNLIHSLGEARNASGGRVLKANDNPWNTVENTTKAPKREFEGRSARELAMEHKESLYSSVGLAGTGRDYVSQELNKRRTQMSGTDSMNSTLNSTTGDASSTPAPPERSSYRAPQQSGGGGGGGGGDFDATAFDSNAAAAYQQRLLDEYRRKKAMSGR